MKILSLLAFLAYASALYAEDISTTDGKTYKDITVSKIEPDGIRILHSEGGAKILFTSLSPESQKKYGYDPVKAKEFQSAEEAKRLASEAAKADSVKTAGEAQAFAEQFKNAKDEPMRARIDSISKDKARFLSKTQYIEGIGYDSGSKPIVISEVDASNLAIGELWIGRVYEVGITTINDKPVRRYTANLPKFIANLGK